MMENYEEPAITCDIIIIDGCIITLIGILLANYDSVGQRGGRDL